MIEIKTFGPGYFLKINESQFYIDPPQLNDNSYIILTQNKPEANRNTIFEAPGEYEVENIYIKSIAKNNEKAFLFYNDFSLLFAREVLEDLYKEIKNQAKDLDIVFVTNLRNPEKWHKDFNCKVFISETSINLPKFNIIKEKSFKINPRRLEHIICQIIK